MKLLEISQKRHLKDCFDFFRINFNLSIVHNIAKKLSQGNFEGALEMIHHEIVFSNYFKHNTQVIKMALTIHTFENKGVHMTLHLLMNQLIKDEHRSPLICCHIILQIEGYDYIVINAN